MKTIQLLVKLSRPFFLLGVAVLYGLGAGIAHYLGITVDWNAYFIGQAWVSLLQLSTQFLNEYYNAEGDESNPNRTILTGGSGAIGPGKLPRRSALLAAMTCLAGLASLTVVLIATLKPGLEVYLIMFLAFLGGFFYSTPPIKLESTGYGELTTTAMVAFMVPSFAFLLQTGEMHRLIAMSSFPLAALMMAMMLAFELPDYATDLKFGKRTMMVRLGWQNGMGMHNILVLSAYLVLMLARLFDYPWFATLAGLLTLPIGIFQIWQMRSIANGGKPNWNLLTTGALALFGSMAYLVAYAFWTH
jgi:1,4-dihydroxy-2-naphthoate polyprenyltransferase